MFKIGDFSKLSRVSVKALRYYDETGLLKPAHVDECNGYRYYSAEQLPRLNRILVLKDLGFSLEQIARLLDEGLSADQIRGMLRLKQAELQAQVAKEKERLAGVEARLQQIEQEDAMPTYEVVLKRVDAQMVASVRDVIPTHNDVGRLFDEVYDYLKQQGGRPTGLYFSLWHDRGYQERDVDAEAVVPVEALLPGNARVRVYQLPGVETMACVVHQGSYDTSGPAYSAMLTWIETNGYQIVGPSRKVYLHGPDQCSNPASYVSEIQFPVAKA